MQYRIDFILNGKGYSYKVAAENEAMARQKFLNWINSKIVSVSELPKNGNNIMDFINGFGK